jgi:uncharacterized membrane protein
VYSRRLRTSMIVAAYAVSSVLAFFLPDMVGWAGRLVLPFFLPTVAVGMCALFRQLASSEPLRISFVRFRETYELILNAAVIFIVGLHLTLLGSLLRGPSHWFVRVLFLLIGSVLVFFGSALPRVRPNPAVGIVAPWTLRSRRVWLSTHRVGGYALAAFGAVILACTAFAPEWLGYLVVLGAATGAVALAAVLYWSGRSRPDSDKDSPDP